MGWESIVIVVLIVVALPYVLGPVLVGATMKFGTRPAIEVVDPAALPPIAAAHLSEHGRLLAAAGFEPGPVVRVEGVAPGTWTYAAMARRADGDMAMAAVIYRRIKTVESPGASYLEFAAEFADGSSVCTNNSPEAPLGPPSDRLIGLRFPRAQDTSRLLALHREGVRRFGRGSRRAMNAAGDWWTRAIRESVERYAEHMRGCGWFARRGESHFGFTLKGALLGTWSNLPPWVWVRRRVLGPREREVARVVGA